MRVTVLGSSASYAGPGQACAGHLVESGTTRVLFDCGHGVVANLSAVTDPLSLDALFITHAHIDHFADIYALQALLRYAPQGPAPALPLYAPEGLLETIGCVLSDNGRRELARAFDVHVIEDGSAVPLADLTVEVAAVDHIDPTYALVAREGDTRLCYTSDTGMTRAVVQAARGCDLLLAEATLPEQYADAAPHLTARQAGEVAREAGAGRLVLVHLWPTSDRGVALEEAAAAFGGEVAVASEMETFSVPEQGRTT
jgi:ribonuclease BN (tRNA processing enzyme)